MAFTYPRLVLSALDLAFREPTTDEVPPGLYITMCELETAGLVEIVSQRRVRLTPAGEERRRLAHGAAIAVAAGLPFKV
jgi:hypothetical protein